MLQRVYTRVSKPAARYSDRGSMAEHCSACRFFMSGGDCARVLGRVLPQGWCKYFSQEAVQRWNPLWPMAGIPAPPGATLDLSFLTSGALDPRITFTRASTATYFNYAGVMQTAAANAPRWDYDPVTHALRGLLIEEARTNLLLNSATLGTQSVAVTAQAYTLSFYGSGTITKSGAATGTLVGTGAFPQRVSQTFTPTAGTLTCTVTGSVLNAQLEASAFPTSYIPTTAATVTRAVDSCIIPPANMGWFVAPGGSWQAEYFAFGAGSRIIGYTTTGQLTPLYVTNLGQVAQYDGSGAANTINGSPFNEIDKGATNYAPGTGKVCLNGGAIASAAISTGYGLLNTGGFGFLTAAGAGSADNTSGYIRRVRYWPRTLSDAEMQSVTT